MLHLPGRGGLERGARSLKRWWEGIGVRGRFYIVGITIGGGIAYMVPWQGFLVMLPIVGLYIYWAERTDGGHHRS